MPVQGLPPLTAADDLSWDGYQARQRTLDERAHQAILGEIPRLLAMERLLREYASSEAFAAHSPFDEPARGADGRRRALLMALRRVVVLANEAIEVLRDADEAKAG